MKDTTDNGMPLYNSPPNPPKIRVYIARGNSYIENNKIKKAGLFDEDKQMYYYLKQQL